MFSSLLSLLILSSAFEVDSGLSLELKSTNVFYDTDGSTSTGAGARLSYVINDPADAFLSFEIDSSFERLFQSSSKFRWLAGLGLAMNETYGPFAFRLAANLLVEHLKSKSTFGAGYRFGLGYYWAKNFGNFIDYGNRFFTRNSSDSTANYIDFSFQFVF